MKATGFTKYIPISEAEYVKFKEQENKQAKAVQSELNRPSALVPLANLQSEKAQVLFNATDDVEKQEQRYIQLSNIVNELKKKVEEQIFTKTRVGQNSDLAFKNIKSDSVRRKAESLLSALGEFAWNSNDELLIDGTAVPQSNKEELLKYATSDWRTTYLDKEPTGSLEFLKVIRDKNISSQLLGKPVRANLQDNNIKGLAVVPPATERKKSRGRPYTRAPVVSEPSSTKKPRSKLVTRDTTRRRMKAGDEILNNEETFQNLMKALKRQ